MRQAHEAGACVQSSTQQQRVCGSGKPEEGRQEATPGKRRTLCSPRKHCPADLIFEVNLLADQANKDQLPDFIDVVAVDLTVFYLEDPLPPMFVLLVLPPINTTLFKLLNAGFETCCGCDARHQRHPIAKTHLNLDFGYNAF